eukprot:NODE_27442_length_513_cov_3.810881.p3 GENE.NODE_27442_length_513_cov_3.810881~~NODE_27442_length_513_cov_3.810881.p3  ORF type:complete len:126 (+),score=23.33 NODE_27442_length_513_cov_3.810881:129-506(+)
MSSSPSSCYFGAGSLAAAFWCALSVVFVLDLFLLVMVVLVVGGVSVVVFAAVVYRSLIVRPRAALLQAMCFGFLELLLWARRGGGAVLVRLASLCSRCSSLSWRWCRCTFCSEAWLRWIGTVRIL